MPPARVAIRASSRPAIAMATMRRWRSSSWSTAIPKPRARIPARSAAKTRPKRPRNLCGLCRNVFPIVCFASRSNAIARKERTNGKAPPDHRQGVPETTIAAIRDNHSRGIPPEDAQIVEFTRALLRKHRVDDATFKAMQARFGNDQLIQLTTAIGYYSMLAMTVNACELEAAPNAEILKV